MLVVHVVEAVVHNVGVPSKMPLAGHTGRVARLLQPFSNCLLSIEPGQRLAITLNAEPVLILTAQQPGAGRNTLRSDTYPEVILTPLVASLSMLGVRMSS